MNSDTDQPKTQRGILLTTILLFSSMVNGTAAALGHEVAVVGDLAEAVELCHARPSLTSSLTWEGRDGGRSGSRPGSVRLPVQSR